jgi:hypothetical protein
MPIGLSKEYVQNFLKEKGIQDATTIQAISELIEQNNVQIERSIMSVVEKDQRDRARRSLS